MVTELLVGVKADPNAMVALLKYREDGTVRRISIESSLSELIIFFRS